MLSTHVPASLHFLVNDKNAILGSIVINHANTNRGYLHAGIVHWHRKNGYGTIMLNLALKRCMEMGINKVQITPHKDNCGAIQTILRNGGVLMKKFADNSIMCLRYEIDLKEMRN